MLEDAAARLKAAGAEIVDAELPSECDGISEVQRRHSAFEGPRVPRPGTASARGASQPRSARPGQDRRRPLLTLGDSAPPGAMPTECAPAAAAWRAGSTRC